MLPQQISRHHTHTLTIVSPNHSADSHSSLNFYPQPLTLWTRLSTAFQDHRRIATAFYSANSLLYLSHTLHFSVSKTFSANGISVGFVISESIGASAQLSCSVQSRCSKLSHLVAATWLFSWPCQLLWLTLGPQLTKTYLILLRLFSDFQVIESEVLTWERTVLKGFPAAVV